MEPPGGRDSRFNLGYSMNLLSGETPPEIYGGTLGRPSTSLQLSPRHTMVSSACGTRGGLKSDVCYDDRGMPSQQNMSLEACGVNDINDDSYSSLQSKKSPPSNGKKTKGRVKIKMEYIENKLRRYTTFSKRKTGIMKKAYELSTLTGTQVMLLVASETGHVYTFATRKLQPMITSEAGKALIQTCLNSPDPPAGSTGGDQRMSATGFEETELTYNTSDDDYKDFEDAQTTSDDEEMAEEDPEGSEEVKRSSINVTNKNKSSQTINTTHSQEHCTKTSKATITEAPEPIINQIKQINNALIQSNKANVAQTQQAETNGSVPTVSTDPLVESSQLTTAFVSPPFASSHNVPINLKSAPLLVHTPNGLCFAAISENMILGTMQDSTQAKLVAIPLSTITKPSSELPITKETIQ